VGPFFHLSFPSRKPWWEAVDRSQTLDTKLRCLQAWNKGTHTTKTA
jgi:hypothetical protein